MRKGPDHPQARQAGFFAFTAQSFDFGFADGRKRVRHNDDVIGVVEHEFLDYTVAPAELLGELGGNGGINFQSVFRAVMHLVLEISIKARVEHRGPEGQRLGS